MTEQSTVLPTTFTSVPVMPVSNSIASHPTGISSTASALLSAASSSSPSPVIRTIRLVSSSAAASPPAFLRFLCWQTSWLFAPPKRGKNLYPW